jgi:two-component system, response regulator PdtaR
MTSLRVLIVEDDAIIAMLLVEVLAGMGHDVCAIEATELGAISAAGRCQPDLMIVDACLRNGSGTSVVDKTHQSGQIPHVFITADSTRITRQRPEAVVVQKPFRESDLAQAIQTVLSAPAAPS